MNENVRRVPAISDDFDTALDELCAAAKFFGDQEAGFYLSNVRQWQVDNASREYYDLLAAFREKFSPVANNL